MNSIFILVNNESKKDGKAYGTSVGKAEGNSPFGKSRRRW
jgi:hypothetical protein